MSLLDQEQSPLEWQELWAVLNRKYKEGNESWTPTTKHMFWEMLEAVPPAFQGVSGFVSGEPWTHNSKGEAVYSAFKQIGDSYFASYVTVREFKQQWGNN